MAKSSTTSNKNFSIFSGLILICYICLGFVPNLQAVDKIAPQWLALSCLNLISIGFLYINRQKFSGALTGILTSWLSLIYIGFIIWAGLSFFYAINSTEVLVNLARQVNVCLMVLIMGIFLFRFPNKNLFISNCVTIILGIEVYAVLVEAMEMVNASGRINSGLLKGVTANRNITAFSIAIKIPFVLFLLHDIKKRFLGVIYFLIIFTAIICLTIIQSRASFIALGVILIGHAGLYFVIYFNQKNKKSLLKILNLIVPLFLAILINKIYLSNLGADAISRAAEISFSANDGSVDKRLRYYEDVITHLSSNPIFGVGLGNWKLKSIDYDSKDIKGYVVPYHAHSDFIQLGAELGVIGFLLYLGIFLLAVYFIYRLLMHSSFSNKDKVFVFFLLIGLGVYSIDANLNFPIARPQVLVDWALIIALIIVFHQACFISKEKIKVNKALNFSFLIIGVLLVLPSIYINKQVYESLKGQMFLLQDFNSNQYNVSLSQIDNIVPDIPNITVTTIPISSMKARYYVNAKKYDKALKLLNKGIKENPYLYYSEILKSQIFDAKGQSDSAKFYARKAFFGLPNNDLHSSIYLSLINKTSDLDALEEAFKLLTAKNKSNNWKNYLAIASNMYPPKNKDLIDKAKKARELFPKDQDFKRLYNKILVGQTDVNLASMYSTKGLKYFDKQDYLGAAQEFEKAIEANPLEYAHYENAATSNYLLNNLEKAEQQIDVVINELNPLNGKCEFIKALIYIKMGDPIGACPLLTTSKDSGYSQAAATFDQYCK